MLNPNAAFEEEMYYQYLRDPDSVSAEWREFFSNSENAGALVRLPENSQTYSSAHNEKIQTQSFERLEPLGSIQAKMALNMEASLEIPSATSQRAIPVKPLDENRRIVNKYLIKMKRPRVSFTHILAWATVKALMKYPNMNDAFGKVDGAPYRIKRNAVNIGLAVDITRKSGSRLLLVPNVKNAQDMNFSEFIANFEEIINKARDGSLQVDDLTGTTVTLTNPGMIGTTSSNPRLMKGQGLIVATGSIDYPVEFQAVRPEVLTTLAVSKVVVMTSTYDHRIIQGAESAEFLAYIAKLLLGGDSFYDQIFATLKIPFEPIRWASDVSLSGKFGISDQSDNIEKSAHVTQMINAYRVRGHLLASINPLGFESYYYPELDPAYYGFTIWDLDRTFHADDSWASNNLPLRDIIELLRDTYCGEIGFEFMHIQDPEKKEWIKTRLELPENRQSYSSEEKLNILKKLIDAESFENFLHTKFVGHKRFSLEGGEAVIVLLDRTFRRAADASLFAITLGMAHRGRLNVLVNCIGKPIEHVFNEFDEKFDPDSYQGSGDVKYHLGYRGNYVSLAKNEIPVILAPNPSHLELVDPLIMGMARALDNEIFDLSYSKTLPVVIHGDSAFAGQGIVAETLNISQLEGYRTGGAIHIVINNQIGFTTTAQSARSSIYATDVAKGIQVPIIHVNGSSPEAVAAAAEFAFDYRQTFKSDVIIDMLCYRKYGHNEADEPSYTQPLLYKKIHSLKPVSQIYQLELIKEGILTSKSADELHQQRRNELNEIFVQSRKTAVKGVRKTSKENQTILDSKTAVNKNTINHIASQITKYPANFNANPKVISLLKKRAEMATSSVPAIDWAMAEALAFGSILVEGSEIRFTGQDTRRGTFSQRHSVLTDMFTEEVYIPLNHIDESQALLRIFDSPLSELAILGFEYGYSITAQNSLTLWEAQFGDFANMAQPVVDQFIAAAEEKWGQTSNLVMLLPHSYDGQGPEHSSGRLERYLQLCAEDNMIICNLSTPAQYFHALRRQIKMKHKMPMIIMTPKSMLRHPLAVSGINELSDESFRCIIDENTVPEKDVKRVILCTGKIYYELLTYIQKIKNANTAIVRVEQLYPLDKKTLSTVFNKYSNTETIVWTQEEPQNMGAWSFIFPYLIELTDLSKIKYAGRKPAASTATGSLKIHLYEQQKLIEQAFA